MILIPKVSLIDAAGKDMGVFSDDPSWWEKLKGKKQTHSEQIDSKENFKASSLNNFNFRTDIKSSEASISFEEESKVFNDTKKVEEDCNMIGETPLHIAIMYDDLNVLKFLIEKKGYDVNQRNPEGNTFSGGFISKEASNLINQSNYEKLAYFGEYPLAFAACFANKEIYDYLVEKGADPNLQGIFNGNKNS